MISLSVLSLLLLGAQAHGQDSCLQTPTQYMDHLKELLGGTTSEIKPICDNVNLMTRIQGIPGWFGWDVQETLNQYGGYWTFAGGVDVAERYLGFARDLQDKLEFAKAALYYVGFSATDIETNTNKQQLVVFDQAMMDSEWIDGTPNGEHPYRSFQPTWDAIIFDYLPYPFQVCSNPGKGDGHTETTAEQCTEREVHIPDDAIANIKAMSYMEITGCPEGFPMEHKELRGEPEDTAACKAKCTGKNGDAYCDYSVPMEYANRDSSIDCIDKYLGQQTSASEFGVTLLARAFFEKCLSFNPFFTGLGNGYSVVDKNVTGTEYIVRGDIALTKLGPAETFVLIEG